MLFPEVDQLLHLQFVYIKPDASSFGHHSKPIVLPHPLHEKGNTTVCLIMRDLDHPLKGKCDHDVDKEAREWVDKLETEYGLTKEHFNKVLTKRQLERVYHSYQERRQLASAYDIFLVDSIVEKSVLRFCGKDFHKAKKVPMRFVVGRHRSLNHQINRSYYTVMFPFSPCLLRVMFHCFLILIFRSLRIGNLSNPMEHLVENVHVAVESVFKYCPGGFINIQSISLQMVTGGSSLPLYISVDEMAIVGELSTLPEGMEVMVHKDGEVKVLSTKSKYIFFPIKKLFKRLLNKDFLMW
ncbi:unnamed protein product [Thelazia callipaeda]|uniref:POP4 domain-containing protein n=1 Tax=Thelazia callipaeda TaxID=103827 RepID=A0A158RCG3_THECL|nr:unnamed protein product [Thelazia callipaeda]